MNTVTSETSASKKVRYRISPKVKALEMGFVCPDTLSVDYKEELKEGKIRKGLWICVHPTPSACGQKVVPCCPRCRYINHHSTVGHINSRYYLRPRIQNWIEKGNVFTTSRASRPCSCCQTPCNQKYTFMTTTKMTKEQEEGFERYLECVRGLDEDQVSRLAAREYGSVLEMYEECA